MLLDVIDAITEKTLLELCSIGCPESDSLDFKRDLPGNLEQNKLEFLKDVCAFANLDGGDLVYGISEGAGGTAGQICPIIGEEFDAVQRRLRQIANGGLEPTVQGMQFRQVAVAGGYVIILRVPPSFDGPHRFKTGPGQYRFVIRTGTNTADMTYNQLRSAFDRTATLAEKARSFREARLHSLRSRTTPKPLEGGPICAMHLIPIASMAGRTGVDVRSIHRSVNQWIEFLLSNDRSGPTNALNLDGLIVHHAGGTVDRYTQIFRQGQFEAVRIAPTQSGLAKSIFSPVVGQFFRNAIFQCVRSAVGHGLVGPAVIGVSMLTVDGYEFWVSSNTRIFNRLFADRVDLVLPEFWVDSLETSSQDLDLIVRPLLDMLWQCFDLERCMLYSQTGAWIGDSD